MGRGSDADGRGQYKEGRGLYCGWTGAVMLKKHYLYCVVLYCASSHHGMLKKIRRFVSIEVHGIDFMSSKISRCTDPSFGPSYLGTHPLIVIESLNQRLKKKKETRLGDTASEVWVGRGSDKKAKLSIWAGAAMQ